MAVEAVLHGVGGIIADLEEGGAILGVDHIEIVVADAVRSPALAEVYVPPPDLFRRGPGHGLFLDDSHADHAVEVLGDLYVCREHSSRSRRRERWGECRLRTLM